MFTSHPRRCSAFPLAIPFGCPLQLLRLTAPSAVSTLPFNFLAFSLRTLIFFFLLTYNSSILSTLCCPALAVTGLFHLPTTCSSTLFLQFQSSGCSFRASIRLPSCFPSLWSSIPTASTSRPRPLFVLFSTLQVCLFKPSILALSHLSTFFHSSTSNLQPSSLAQVSSTHALEPSYKHPSINNFVSTIQYYLGLFT